MDAPTPLFGGALTCILPPLGSWFDVSRVRPAVPDNQEVFVLGDTDSALIVEILERADVPDDAALAFLFGDLGEQAGAAQEGTAVDASAAGVDAPLCPEAGYVGSLSGVQRSPPPRGAVRVTLGLVRLAQHSADVLLSLSSSLEGGGTLADAARARAAMDEMLKTFRVVDAGLLFADPKGDT